MIGGHSLGSVATGGGWQTEIVAAIARLGIVTTLRTYSTNTQVKEVPPLVTLTSQGTTTILRSKGNS